MLSITPDFNIQDIQNDFIRLEQNIKDSIVQALTKTLKTLVDKARGQTAAENGFNNITWNLRASFGGVILRDHQIVKTYFPLIQDGDEGHETGLGYAIDVATMHDDGEIIMVIVAGMDYAKFVERKGKDVISHVVGDNLADELIKVLK